MPATKIIKLDRDAQVIPRPDLTRVNTQGEATHFIQVGSGAVLEGGIDRVKRLIQDLSSYVNQVEQVSEAQREALTFLVNEGRNRATITNYLESDIPSIIDVSDSAHVVKPLPGEQSYSATDFGPRGSEGIQSL